MGFLLAASLIWALSFGLIKHVLVDAGIHPYAVAAVRLGLSSMVFLPWMRPRRTGRTMAVQLFLTGAVQYGVMYLAYTQSFRHLDAHQVALFTVTTPLYVAALHAAHARHWHARLLMAAGLAVIGGALVLKPASARLDSGVWRGLALVQVSNAAFALGQVRYRRLLGDRETLKDAEVFAWLYQGGLAVALGPAIAAGRAAWSGISWPQILTLLYLGVVPSGLGFFFWNVGARRARPASLAVMNNAKIPLSVLCALVVFGERAGLWRLGLGGSLLLLAVAWAERREGQGAIGRS